MAWTVAFALLGALIFSMVLALAPENEVTGKHQRRKWHNPVLLLPTTG
jgi:hypothetical protein